MNKIREMIAGLADEDLFSVSQIRTALAALPEPQPVAGLDTALDRIEAWSEDDSPESLGDILRDLRALAAKQPEQPAPGVEAKDLHESVAYTLCDWDMDMADRSSGSIPEDQRPEYLRRAAKLIGMVREANLLRPAPFPRELVQRVHTCIISDRETSGLNFVFTEDECRQIMSRLEGGAR